MRETESFGFTFMFFIGAFIKLISAVYLAVLILFWFAKSIWDMFRDGRYDSLKRVGFTALAAVAALAAPVPGVMLLLGSTAACVITGVLCAVGAGLFTLATRYTSMAIPEQGAYIAPTVDPREAELAAIEKVDVDPDEAEFVLDEPANDAAEPEEE